VVTPVSSNSGVNAYVSFGVDPTDPVEQDRGVAIYS